MQRAISMPHLDKQARDKVDAVREQLTAIRRKQLQDGEITAIEYDRAVERLYEKRARKGD